MSRSTQSAAPAATAPAPAEAPSTAPAVKVTRSIALDLFHRASADPTITTEAVVEAFTQLDGPGRIINEAVGEVTSKVMSDPSWAADPEKLAIMSRATQLRTAVEAAIAAARPQRSVKAADPEEASRVRVSRAASILLRIEAEAAAFMSRAIELREKAAQVPDITEGELNRARAQVATITQRATAGEADDIARLFTAQRAAGGTSEKARLDITQLVPGQVLVHSYRDGRTEVCTYHGPTSWEVNGSTYESATAAAKACLGPEASVNGLVHWRIAE